MQNKKKNNLNKITACFLKTSSTIFTIALFLSFGIQAHAQTETQLPSIPTAQEISNNLNLDQFSASSVSVVVSASGVIGTTSVLSAITNNISDNTSDFQWYLDDKLMSLQSGKARTTFSFKTTKQTHIVRLVIVENGQSIAENSVSVNSFSVSLLWSTNTFVPADYEGKALPTVGSAITLNAIPDIQGENPEDLLYTWVINSESRVRGVANEQSISFHVTKNVLSIPVVVEVSNASQSVLVRQAINIPVVHPLVVLYHYDQNPTILSYRNLFLGPGEKTNVLAQPYYFHIQQASDLSYSWRFANTNAKGEFPDPNILILSIPENSGAGNTSLTVVAENPLTPGEQTTGELLVYIL